MRRGSTLVIVIALLGLLAFTGIVFYTFASQERSAASYFSEAAKSTHSDPGGVWPHMLEQILVGPSERYRGSILYSPNRRHSLVANMLGDDVYPHNSPGLDVSYLADGQPTVLNQSDELLNFVDSPAARNGQYPEGLPAADVDYTYPDINSLFLAHKGWAVRVNADGTQTQVPVIIPSFFRPQYMRQEASDEIGRFSAGFTRQVGSKSFAIPTNHHWAYAYQLFDNALKPVAPDLSTRDTVLFSKRSFRPHPSHLAGITSDGVRVRRYLTDEEAATPGINLQSGGFPFLPEESRAGRGNGIRGDLGIWTGSPETVYELDSDNDGDGITEGIWLDLQFPIQEHLEPDGTIRTYAVLHSVTIYDLDGLLNLNVHGNLAGLSKPDSNSSASATASTLSSAYADGRFSSFLSRSHHGLGPNEVNPIWGLRRIPKDPGPYENSITDSTLAALTDHYGHWPTDSVQQANMEWLWLLTGRGEYRSHSVTRSTSGKSLEDASVYGLENILDGRWGEAERLYAALQNSSARLRISDLPRPGRSGIDDNRNRKEGGGWTNGQAAFVRPYRHPISFSGLGQRTVVDVPVFDRMARRFRFSHADEYFGNDMPLAPLLLSVPETSEVMRFPGYVSFASAAGPASQQHYSYGPDGVYSGTNATLRNSTGDDLNHFPAFDELFDDPLETIFDQELANHQHDSLFGIGETVALQWPSEPRAAIKLSDSKDRVQNHVSRLAPHAFNKASDNRQMFTTHSNALTQNIVQRDAARSWEFSADTDGADRNGDGFGDGDGHPEFPPAFGSTPNSGRPFSATDPFRPQVRRLLTNEIGERRSIAGGMPISPNHLLDVDRNSSVPREGTPQFLRFMQRSGLRFRKLTEHPIASESTSPGRNVLDLRSVPTIETSADNDRNTVRSASAVPFPPRSVAHQEFWARRDRQLLARDIFVLLYTIGGAERSSGAVRDYTGHNDPNADAGIALYNHDQLRRMAQFAVNLVDAMDTDSAITKFEYDKNLGNGWNIDDDPFSLDELPLPTGAPGSPAGELYLKTTSGGLYPEDTSSRGVVYGVESQHLAINEALAVRCGKTEEKDHFATPHEDHRGERDHLFVELINTLPEALNLASSRSTSPTTGLFRLARFDRVEHEAPLSSSATPTAAVTFLADAGVVNGGDIFTIGCASDASVVNSDLFVDWNADSTFELIAPNVESSVLPTRATDFSEPSLPELQPRTQLDLIFPAHATGRFVVTNDRQTENSNAGAFLDELQTYYGSRTMKKLSADLALAGGPFSAKWSDVGFDLVLQRRLNQEMPSLSSTSGQSADVNPWIEIDRIRVEFEQFALTDSDKETDLTGHDGRLARLRSQERKDPLDDPSRQPYAYPETHTNYRMNSIGSPYNNSWLRDPSRPRNDESGTRSNRLGEASVWQPHFDRDLTSAGELLQIPLFGPRLLTQRLNVSCLSPRQQTLSTASEHQVSGAAAMFLQPTFDPLSPEKTHLNNSWYRLFQFVQVPSRVHRMLGNPINQQTVPGKINVNTIRHMEVLAGLIDDPMIADPDANRAEGPFLAGHTPGAAFRDAWTEFLQERDGRLVDSFYDPTPHDSENDDEATQFLIPGTPGSRPFRSYGYVTQTGNDSGVDHTLLRRLMEDRDEDRDGDDDELTFGVLADDDDADLVPDDSVTGGPQDNRHWLEPGASALHTHPMDATTPVERYQVLSKIMNNTTTVSNTFVVFATAAYFEAYEDPETGFYRIGGRMDLDDEDGRNPGWQQRAVFVIDRTEALKALDPGSGSFDWKRLVKFQTEIE